MKSLVSMKNFAMRLWRDEEGAEMIEKILIIAAVALPLLLVLLIFRDRISEKLAEWWEPVRDDTFAPDDYVD